MTEDHPTESRLYPSRPLIGVGAVVWRDGRVLLVRRARPPRQGQWSLPGGLQRVGETVFAAAEREVREETGIRVAVLGVVDVVDSIERDEAGRVRYHYTLIDVVAAWRGGRLAPADDAADAVWARLGDLGGYDLWRETDRIIRMSYRMLSRWR